jgi:PAS domain S-box-containing protein
MKKSKIYRFYYLLASINLLSISFSFIFGFSIHQIYEQSFNGNKEWLNRIHSYEEATRLIIEANGPGNHVFETKAVEVEQARFKEKIKHLNQTLSELSRDLSVNLKNNLSIKSGLESVKEDVKLGTENTYILFTNIRLNNVDEASNIMSKMDRSFHAAMTGMSSLKVMLRTLQRLELETNHGVAFNFFRIQLLISIILIIIILFVLIYGKRIKNKIEIFENEIIKSHAQLQSYEIGLNEHSIVAKTDSKGCITYVNESFCNISGYSKDELIGSNHRIINSEYHSKEFFKNLWKTILSGQKWRGDIKNQAKDGSYYWVDTSITPIKDSEGKIKEFLSIRTEITKQKETQIISNEIQSIAHIGGWELNIKTMKTLWTDETYRIHELEVGTPTNTEDGISYYAEHEKTRIASFVNNCIQNGTLFESEFDFVTAKGNHRRVLVKGIPQMDLEGKVSQIVGIIQDITLHFKSAARIKDNENKLRQLFMQSKDAVMTLSPPTWNFISCNPSALALFNVATEEEFRKLGPWDVAPEFQPDGQASVDKAKLVIGLAMENGSHFFEWTHKTLEGKEIPCTVLLSRIEEDKSKYLHAVVRDITVNKELDKQIKISHHQAKLASIGELAAGVGHEINNPIAIIQGYISAINKKFEKNPDTSYGDLKPDLDRINIAAKRISNIVEGLRTFSRSDSIEKNEYDPIVAIEESFNLVSEIYEHDGIDFSLSFIPSKDNVVINGNRGKFQQVLMNIMSNAKDAVSNNMKKEIKICCEINKNEMSLEIQDNGHGIPNSIQEKIFEPFFTTKELHKGTGIGLSLVYSLINEMGGTLSVNSKENEGSSFLIKLPVYQTSPKEQEQEQEQEQVKFEGNIIVVDDEEDIRELLCDILEETGIKVTAASNGQIAFDLYRQNPEKYDLIISDMQMPEMDGPTLLRKIRDDKNLKQPKFIFITGGINLNFEDKAHNLARISDGFITKPFKDHEIFELLSNFLLE